MAKSHSPSTAADLADVRADHTANRESADTRADMARVILCAARNPESGAALALSHRFVEAGKAQELGGGGTMTRSMTLAGILLEEDASLPAGYCRIKGAEHFPEWQGRFEARPSRNEWRKTTGHDIRLMLLPPRLFDAVAYGALRHSVLQKEWRRE